MAISGSGTMLRYRSSTFAQLAVPAAAALVLLGLLIRSSGESEQQPADTARTGDARRAARHLHRGADGERPTPPNGELHGAMMLSAEERGIILQRIREEVADGQRKSATEAVQAVQRATGPLSSSMTALEARVRALEHQLESVRGSDSPGARGVLPGGGAKGNALQAPAQLPVPENPACRTVAMPVLPVGKPARTREEGAFRLPMGNANGVNARVFIHGALPRPVTPVTCHGYRKCGNAYQSREKQYCVIGGHGLVTGSYGRTRTIAQRNRAKCTVAIVSSKCGATCSY